jgi:hypothetical protein
VGLGFVLGVKVLRLFERYLLDTRGIVEVYVILESLENGWLRRLLSFRYTCTYRQCHLISPDPAFPELAKTHIEAKCSPGGLVYISQYSWP